MMRADAQAGDSESHGAAGKGWRGDNGVGSVGVLDRDGFAANGRAPATVAVKLTGWPTVDGFGAVVGQGGYCCVAMYVNWSALDVAEVAPLLLVTVTSTMPLPAGAMAVICVPELSVKLVAAMPRRRRR